MIMVIIPMIDDRVEQTIEVEMVMLMEFILNVNNNYIEYDKYDRDHDENRADMNRQIRIR